MCPSNRQQLTEQRSIDVGPKEAPEDRFHRRYYRYWRPSLDLETSPLDYKIRTLFGLLVHSFGIWFSIAAHSHPLFALVEHRTII
jgi:hypothetical protein